MNRISLAIPLALVGFVGCTPTAFSPHFQDNNVQDVKQSMANVAVKDLDQPQNITGKPLAFMVTSEPTQIIAYDLQAGRTLWQQPAAVDSKVAVGRSHIYYRVNKDQLEAREIQGGSKVWTTELLGGQRLLGIAADGDNVYYTTENRKRESDGTVAYLVAISGQSGKKRWMVASKGRLGAPTAQAGRVFLPLRYQSIAIVDGATGQELARVRSKEEALIWVRKSQTGILYGSQNGVYRLDERSASGTKKGSTFVSAPLPRLVRSVYWWDGYNAALSGYTAYDRNRLLWNLEPDGEGFLNDLLILHNYRFFFGFETSKMGQERSGLKWAFNLPRQDVVASNYTGSALLLVTDKGDIIYLDPRVGLPVKQEQLKVGVVGVSFDTRGFVLAGRAQGTADLRKALTEIIWDPDRRFGMVKLFAVEQLAQLPGENVTKDLVKIVSYEKVDPAVYKRAGEMIVGRKDKGAIPLYLETLKTHFNFIEGTSANAVDVMARALGELKAQEAVRPLLLHLADPVTPLPAVEAIVKSLNTIGSPLVLEPFRDYLLTYRCDELFKKAPGVLTAVSEGLIQLGGETERRLLNFVEMDAHTLGFLRAYLDKALKQTAPAKMDEGAPAAAQSAGAGATVSTPKTAPAAAP